MKTNLQPSAFHPARWGVALLASVSLLCGCHRSPENETPLAAIRAEKGRIVIPDGSPQRASVNVEAAQACQSSVMAHLNGQLIWDENVTGRVFTPFTGRATQIMTEIGKEVRKGDGLALIASPDYGRAQADYRSAVSAFLLSEKNLSRTKELLEHGAAAQKDLFSAEADFEKSKSELERTTALLALYGGNTNAVDQAYELRSPLDGIVVEKNVNPGQELRSDAMLANAERFFSPLFVVTDPTRLWIQLEATELDLAKIKEGQEIVVHSKAFPGVNFPGRIEVISDSLDHATRIVRVRGVVENPHRLLKAEMFVEADVPIPAAASGADVPSDAVFTKGEKSYVFLEESPGRYERREVRVGPEHGPENDKKVLVLDGVQPGQRVVTKGGIYLDKTLQDSSGS
jgi:cobalt-zinc-cadmium efflux system membrane fusion protein